jgi:hypothetical protein
VEENQSGIERNVSLAKQCFVAKNSAEERRIMVNLEKNMQAALSFARGGEEPDNSPWIIRILLGRMIRERTEIGKAIKALEKFQRREVMRGLVKLGDLEDLADPPSLGSYTTPSSPQCLQHTDGLHQNMEEPGNFPSGEYLRPEDSPPGILSPAQS